MLVACQLKILVVTWPNCWALFVAQRHGRSCERHPAFCHAKWCRWMAHWVWDLQNLKRCSRLEILWSSDGCGNGVQQKQGKRCNGFWARIWNKNNHTQKIPEPGSAKNALGELFRNAQCEVRLGKRPFQCNACTPSHGIPKNASRLSYAGSMLDCHMKIGIL